MRPYVIDGVEIERIPANAGAYALIAYMTFGKRLVVATGDNPGTVRAAERTVARNPRVIDRIVLVDRTGPLETIWSKTW